MLTLIHGENAATDDLRRERRLIERNAQLSSASCVSESLMDMFDPLRFEQGRPIRPRH